MGYLYLFIIKGISKISLTAAYFIRQVITVCFAVTDPVRRYAVVAAVA